MLYLPKTETFICNSIQHLIVKSQGDKKMEISARNLLQGKIQNVELGAVMANVKIEVNEPNTITAVITKESAEKLGLKEGDDVAAIIKSTEVIIGK
jgi:molybdopterin-binding protein